MSEGRGRLDRLDVWKIIVRFTLPYILNGLLVKCELEVGLNRGRKLEQRDQDSYCATVARLDWNCNRMI